MFFTIARFINHWFYPPPANAAVGYKWVANQGVPDQLSIYDWLVGEVPPGIYVAFQTQILDATVDPFGRIALPAHRGAPPIPAAGTVYDAVLPAGPSAGVTAFINRARGNPPAGEAALYNPPNSAAPRLTDITGFLTYAGRCLDLINRTAVGAQLLANINQGQKRVFIVPASGGDNMTFALTLDYLNTMWGAIDGYARGQQLPLQQIRQSIAQRYPLLASDAARYNQLAADMNALALATLFQPGAAWPNFLNANFRFRGERLTGQNLRLWLSDGGFAAFDGFIRTTETENQRVKVRQAFLLALSILLYEWVPAGAGARTNITFNVLNRDENNLASPNFRPPAIGLAHELVHALHYIRGTSPGKDEKHFTTSAAELLFTGIGPFAAQPITENAIRNQWGTIFNVTPAAAIDASNVWAAPVARTTYAPPVAPDTPTELRRRWRCI